MKNRLHWVLWCLPLLPAACSDVDGADSEVVEEDRFSFGSVTAVTATTLSMKEYDFVADADVVCTYEVTTDTEFGVVMGLADLRPGDDVVVDYLLQDGRRIVTMLVKDTKTPADFDPALEPLSPTDSVGPVDDVAAPQHR